MSRVGKIEWRYGENKSQMYYEANVGDDYLCVFQNRWQPGIWMGICRDRMIHDKTYNDRERRREGLDRGCPVYMLRQTAMLCSQSPEYMMKKVEHCYRYNKCEVCR